MTRGTWAVGVRVESPGTGDDGRTTRGLGAPECGSDVTVARLASDMGGRLLHLGPDWIKKKPAWSRTLGPRPRRLTLRRTARNSRAALRLVIRHLQIISGSRRPIEPYVDPCNRRHCTHRGKRKANQFVFRTGISHRINAVDADQSSGPWLWRYPGYSSVTVPAGGGRTWNWERQTGPSPRNRSRCRASRRPR